MSDDQALLGEFVRHGSQAAFAALVERYAGLVFASARRQVRDEHLADDVTQAVFIVLARRAGSISDAAVLPAWLIKTTCFASRDVLKMQARRRKHERKAAEMTSTQTPSPDPSVADLEPILDAALARLKQLDRNIVARRFLQQQSVEQVAGELKMSEAAVRKRLSRAMPRLRSFLASRGVTLSVALLATLLDQLRPSSASAALIESATTGALSGSDSTSAGTVAQRIVRRIFLVRLGGVVTAILLVLALVLGAGWTIHHSAGPIAPVASANPGAIKVGILVSDYSANSPNDNGVKNGYLPLAVMLRALDDPSLDRFAVIEPGTAQNADLARIVGTYFPPNHMIDGADAEALRNLDVLVCPISINMRDEVLSAFIRAVSDGVGILNQCATGCNRPGMSEPVNAINGMTRFGCFYNNTGAIDCTIVGADHPLMTRFRNPTVRLRNLSGSIGIIRQGQALIAAPGVHNHHPVEPAPPAEAAYFPLYVSTLGKGRIMGVGWGEAQPAIDAAAGPDFYVRCVRWLALRGRTP
jgi:RNA polymerase sigma factor (sigma-70 family)